MIGKQTTAGRWADSLLGTLASYVATPEKGYRAEPAFFVGDVKKALSVAEARGRVSALAELHAWIQENPGSNIEERLGFDLGQASLKATDKKLRADSRHRAEMALSLILAEVGPRLEVPVEELLEDPLRLSKALGETWTHAETRGRLQGRGEALGALYQWIQGTVERRVQDLPRFDPYRPALVASWKAFEEKVVELMEDLVGFREG